MHLRIKVQTKARLDALKPAPSPIPCQDCCIPDHKEPEERGNKAPCLFRSGLLSSGQQKAISLNTDIEAPAQLPEPVARPHCHQSPRHSPRALVEAVQPCRAKSKGLPSGLATVWSKNAQDRHQMSSNLSSVRSPLSMIFPAFNVEGSGSSGRGSCTSEFRHRDPILRARVELSWSLHQVRP